MLKLFDFKKNILWAWNVLGIILKVGAVWFYQFLIGFSKIPYKLLENRLIWFVENNWDIAKFPECWKEIFYQIAQYFLGKNPYEFGLHIRSDGARVLPCPVVWDTSHLVEVEDGDRIDVIWQLQNCK